MTELCFSTVSALLEATLPCASYNSSSSLILSCPVQRWLQRTMCVAFFMALFAGLFQASVYGTGDLDVIYVYEFIIKTLGCLLLACSANVMKTLFAKLLSNHFYRDSYFEKMQDALCKASLAKPSTRMEGVLSCVDITAAPCAASVLLLPAAQVISAAMRNLPSICSHTV